MSSQTPAPENGSPRRGNATRWILGGLGIAVIALFAWYLRGGAKSAGGAGAGAPSASASAERVVPVIVVPVMQRDVPIVLEGLGNAVPLQSVLVKPQIDGRLDSVNFKEGQSVKRGDLLAQVDPRPLAIQLRTAEATLAKDAAQLRNAQLTLERYMKLIGEGLITQQQVDDQRTVVDQFVAQVNGDKAQADNVRLQLEYARIVSPLDGVTGVRMVDPGNIVHANDATGIVVITQLDPIGVLFTLPEDDLARVSQKLAEGPITVVAVGRDGTTKLGTGELLLIDNQINTTTATIRLKATFANPQRLLWPNEFVKARLLLTTRTGVTVVPSTVVQRGPTGTFAYVVGPDKTVSMRPVEVESTQGETSIIARGLTPGEQVVADGQNQIRPGSKVSPRPAPDASAPSPRTSASPSPSAPRERRVQP